MTILDCNNTVYDNAIEMHFHDFFDGRGIEISGLEYKRVDNGVFEAAFRYIYKKLFKPDQTTVRYNNKNTKINLRDIDELNTITNIYIDLVKGYNIIPFDKYFLELTGIHKDTWNSWKNEEYSHDGLSTAYSDLWRKIHDLPMEQVRNKMADDRIGIQSLANNDREVGLEYNEKRQIEAAQTRIMTVDELPRLDTELIQKDTQLIKNNSEIQ